MTDGRRVGASLRLLREAAGMTPSTLADAVGIGVHHLDAIERGDATPSTEFVALAVAVVASHLREPHAPPEP